MGSESSKLEAPEEFGQSGNQFQIISPVSDLSCPSDIHRINRLRRQQGAKASIPTDPSRRLSKTVTKNLSNKRHQGSVPTPAHFYFPSKDAERAVEKAEIKSVENEKETAQKRNIVKGTKKIIKKTHKAMKKTQKAMQGCFSDEHAAEIEAPRQIDENKHHPTLGIAKKVLSKKSKHVRDYDAKPAYDAMDDPSVTPIETKVKPSHVGYHVPSTQKRENDERPLLDSLNKADFTHPALHQADDYFSRLTGGGHGESPYVSNKHMLGDLPSALGPEDPDSPVSNLFEDKKENKAAPSPESSLAESDVQRSRHSVSSFKSPSDSVLQYQKDIGTIAETPGYYPEDEEDDESFFEEKKEDSLVSRKAGNLSTIVEKAEEESSSISASQTKNANSAFRERVHSSESQKSIQQALVLSSHGSHDGRKVSKLESLFRPVLPTLSADDAHSASGFDRYEIKLTESAPSVLENTEGPLGRASDNFHKMTALERKLEIGFSPSNDSVESNQGRRGNLVSKQARYNSEFLFADKQRTQSSKAGSYSDKATISTLGSRSRLTNRGPSAKAVAVYAPRDMVVRDDRSQTSRESSRKSRFSLLDAVSGSVGLAPKESIDFPSIESKISNLTDAMEQAQQFEADYEKPQVGQWSNTNDGVTPFREGMDSKDATNSPYLRFKTAKTRFEEKNQATIDIPSIENKVSDLTEATADDIYRSSTGSSVLSNQPMTEEVDDADIAEDVPEEPQQVHWSYSVKDGNISAVTPYFGKDAKNATKSPYLRFEHAKNKFGSKNLSNKNDNTALVKKETAIVKKDVPYKSPRSGRTKPEFILRPLKTGGSVASRVQELNKRVVDAKIDRKKHRWTKSNPRKYGVVESNAVRTRAIVQYKTDVIGLDKFNYMSAAKFNAIPIDDDSSVGSFSAAASRESKKSVTFAEPASLLQLNSYKHDDEPVFEDDDVSKYSTDELSKLTTDSHSTVRQDRARIMSKNYAPNNLRVSESTYSTSSSGVSNIKKQIFRGSTSSSSATNRPSSVSHSDSTTMSSILEKENSNYRQFKAGANTVKPTQQAITKLDLHLSPAPAQKWRSLAAAAQMRDSANKSKNGHLRQGLKVKNANFHPGVAYGY